MEQFEQLLTCCVCLDRYRIPKLLPCQHSFCMEPCMEGLVDYVRRQVKCPECRAEHRIPYQGVQAFPTNVTLQRFLELHIEITGELPDPTSGQIMERCNVCSEKAYCSLCAHCDKKICEDCKSAHMDILRREIVRINSQIRRGIGRLQESLSVVERNMLSLQSNCVSVSEEVDEIYRRLAKALKDRNDHLRSEVDRYLGTEFRNLTHLKENLEQEITNIQSNCDLADKFINDNVEWEDGELMDTKEIFLKTVDFIRNFEYENGDYNRRVRFSMAIDPHQLVMNVSTFGDLNISHPPAGSVTSGGLLQPPSSAGPGLMRSKSDHRLASQFRQQEEQYDNEPALGGRKFGERPAGRAERHGDRYGRSGGGGGGDYGDYGDHDNDSSSTRTGKSRFRSRFVRSHQGDNDSDTETGRSVRFNEKDKEKERDKVIDTEDVARGQLSGIIRLADSPRVMKRIQDQTREKKEKKDVAPAPPPQVKSKAGATPAKAPPAARQVSEDDEIARIKRQNKGAATSTATATAPTTTTTTATAESERPATERTSNAATTRTLARAASTESTSSSDATPAANTTTTSAVTGTRQRSTAGSGEGSGTSTPERKAFQSRFLPNHQSSPTGSVTASAAGGAGDKSKAKESESSSEEETSSDESETETEEEKVKPTPTPTRPTATSSAAASSRSEAGTQSPVRRSREETSRSSGYASPSSYSRSSNYDRDDSPKYGQSASSTTSSGVRSRPSTTESDRYGGASSSSGYTSRFLNKSKSSAVVDDADLSNAEDSDRPHYSRSLTNGHSASKTGSPLGVTNNSSNSNNNNEPPAGRSRYLALKERRTRLARSRSSHNLGDDEDIDDDDPPLSPTTASPSAYLASRYGASSSMASPSSDLSRSRSSHALKASRESSPDRSAAGNDKDGAALSSWARYLKNKYGNRTSSKDGPPSSAGTTSSSSAAAASPSSSSSSASRRLSLGLPLRQANEFSSEDDSKNAEGSPTSPMAAVGMHHGGMSPRTNYLQKRRQLYQLGGRGSEPGSFTWPRGIAVGPDSSIVVADSSNHRVQVFDANGCFVREFGQYGSGEGEFDCLAGVAVNRIGQFIIADRYNHRIQVLDPSGRFLRAFGSQGSADGKFNYPWGLTTDALGFIYVCDKENHRVQVFQSDGTFVGKFGSLGSGTGQLEHPHYIAVSNTNRVIVSDSNNHRVQVFDVNGKVLNQFGSEGSEEGQFKFPRGVAVDDQGFICVADSGNNRIQIFHPDGSFLRAFGSWGSNDGEFKGLEGVAMMSNGNILVCDRENHRVQVF